MKKLAGKRFWDVTTDLYHFALITFAIEPKLLEPLIHPRFKLRLIKGRDGSDRAMLSVVPFLDQDFHFNKLPFWKHTFGQTNYRVYVIDQETGEDVVWFLGTVLDSWTVGVPRYLWKLPWHGGKMRFNCNYDADEKRYVRYQVQTKSKWAGADFELSDRGLPIASLQGFDDLEEGKRVLTHPSKGYFYRRVQKLGAYQIWHDWLEPTEGEVLRGSFELLDELGLVGLGDTSQVHSVMIQPKTTFEIYLPPVKIV